MSITDDRPSTVTPHAPAIFRGTGASTPATDPLAFWALDDLIDIAEAAALALADELEAHRATRAVLVEALGLLHGQNTTIDRLRAENSRLRRELADSRRRAA